MVAKQLTAIGLMSGTSMDGIDVALIDTDGEEILSRGPFVSIPYSADFRKRLSQSLQDARGMNDRGSRPGNTGEVEAELTELHAEAVGSFLEAQGLEPDRIDVIGFHGHTILHKPSTHLTVQIGQGAELASRTGISVVNDLRGADMAAGGQGAPVAPVYHRALAQLASRRPTVFVNIGGVANVTFVGSDETLLAFDTGPGNALLDDWALRHTGEPWDRDGRLAARGQVHKDMLDRFLADPYFDLPPPKSADRNSFSAPFLEALSPQDGAATLVYFTAATIARAQAEFPERPENWIVCGGGRKNPVIMQALRDELEPQGQQVMPLDSLGLNGDAVEAEAFAYMAVRSLYGLPITFPGTTGVPRPMSGGVLHRPQ